MGASLAMNQLVTTPATIISIRTAQLIMSASTGYALNLKLSLDYLQTRTVITPLFPLKPLIEINVISAKALNHSVPFEAILYEYNAKLPQPDQSDAINLD